MKKNNQKNISNINYQQTIAHVPKSEMETTIRFDAEGKTAELWTCDIRYIKKLDKLCEIYPNDYKKVKSESFGDATAVWYTLPKKFIQFKKPRILTEEERKQIRQRMLLARGKMPRGISNIK